jgi:hypothetical protein
MVLPFVRLALFLKRSAFAASLVSSSTSVILLWSLRGSKVITTAIIIPQAPLGAVKSTRARSRGLTTIIELALFKFPFASPCTRQIPSSGPKKIGVSQLSLIFAFQDYLDSATLDLSQTRASQKKILKRCSHLHGKHYFYLDHTEC